MMSNLHWYVLYGYAAFVGLATLLTLLGRRPQSESGAGSIARKYRTYILINLTFLTASWLPQDWRILTALLALVSGLASWEIARALRVADRMRWILPFVSAGLVMSADWLQPMDFIKLWWVTLLVTTAVCALGMPREHLGRHVISLMGCLVYVPSCLAAYLWLWHTDAAGFRAVFLYMTVAANDAFAQVTGQLLGRHPLAPQISPAKTVEGALGGILFAAAIGAGLSRTVGWSYARGASMGAIVGLTGLVGDLTESGWKRSLGLKDFSTLLGAQGGVLDRFDALIFAAPIFYLLSSA